MVTGFLILYHTDVVGAEAAAIATLIFVVRYWDAFADLLADLRKRRETPAHI